jgi:pyrophosphate--fructose-6-phosphate 1-phosphotransferase
MKKNYGIVLIPEGLIEFIPEMNVLIKEINDIFAEKKEEVKEKSIKEIKEIIVNSLSENNRDIFNFLPSNIANQLLLDRDPHGNVQVAKI